VADSRVVTFVFTDLVDSTRLLHALGDARFDELARPIRDAGVLELKGVSHVIPAVEILWEAADERLPLPAPLARRSRPPSRAARTSSTHSAPRCRRSTPARPASSR